MGFGDLMELRDPVCSASHLLTALWAANPTEFRFFQKPDQSAIFLLIAGTNAPGLAVLLGGSPGMRGLTAMWGLAAAGVGSLWVFARPPHEAVVGICLGMGWLGFLP